MESGYITADYYPTLDSMLSTLDRYIIKKYLATFFFVALLFSMVSIVVELGERIEKMIESDLSTWEIATDYFLAFLPWINGILWPLYALLAVIFFTSRLAQQSEIISMLNAGMSFWRIFRPYLICSVLLAGMHYVGKHYLIPTASKQRLAIYNTHFSSNKEIGKSRNIHIFLDPNTKAYFSYYNKRDSSGHKFIMERFDHGKLIELYKAEKLELIENPNRWRMHNYSHRVLYPEPEMETFNRGTLDTTLNLHHSDFIRYVNENEMLTSPEIRHIIRRDVERGVSNARPYRMELALRHAEPFTLIILTLIGVALAGRKTRGGLGMNLALGMIIGACYIVLGKFSMTLAAGEGMPVWLGIWLPNIVFGIIALVLASRAQR